MHGQIMGLLSSYFSEVKGSGQTKTSSTKTHHLKTPVDGWNLILFWSQRKQDFSNTENVTREMSSDFVWFQTSLLPLEPKLKRKLGAFAHQLFDTFFSRELPNSEVNLSWINQPISWRCFLDACFQYALLMFTSLFGKIAWLVDISPTITISTH